MASRRVCPHTVTIFNYLGEDGDGNAEYSASVLKYVHAHIKEGIGAKSVADDETRVHIFDSTFECDKSYLPESEWLALSSEDKKKHWTLNAKGRDYFCFGDFGSSESNLPDFNLLFRIVGFSRLEMGSKRLHHWKVVAE